MTNSKMTYAEALTVVLDTCDLPIEVTDKLTALREQIAKRNSAERKPTKAQKANEELKAVVFDAISTDPQTVTEIMAKDERLSTLSNQKVSALVNALVRDGKVLKIPDGRKSTFAKA
jgi:polyribonucleotide nucleotidyltransferase